MSVDTIKILVIDVIGQSKTSWNKAKIFAAVVRPELMRYSSDIACATDVVVGKSFALSSK